MQSWEGLGMADVYYPNTAVPWRPEWPSATHPPPPSSSSSTFEHFSSAAHNGSHTYYALPTMSPALSHPEWPNGTRSVLKPITDEPPPRDRPVADSGTITTSASWWPSPKTDPEGPAPASSAPPSGSGPVSITSHSSSFSEAPRAIQPRVPGSLSQSDPDPAHSGSDWLPPAYTVLTQQGQAPSTQAPAQHNGQGQQQPMPLPGHSYPQQGLMPLHHSNNSYHHQQQQQQPPRHSHPYALYYDAYPPSPLHSSHPWQAAHPTSMPVMAGTHSSLQGPGKLSPPRRGPSEDDERPWKCPVDTCGKTYRFKGDLKYHVQHKHAEHPDLPSQISRPRSDKLGKEYPCPWASCASGFKWERDLKRHIKVKHNCEPEYAAYWARFENMAQQQPMVEAPVMSNMPANAVPGTMPQASLVPKTEADEGD